MNSHNVSRIYRQHHSVYRTEDRAARVEAQPVIDVLVVDSEASGPAVVVAPVVDNAASVRVAAVAPAVDNAALELAVASVVAVAVVVENNVVVEVVVTVTVDMADSVGIAGVVIALFAVAPGQACNQGPN